MLKGNKVEKIFANIVHTKRVQPELLIFGAVSNIMQNTYMPHVCNKPSSSGLIKKMK